MGSPTEITVPGVPEIGVGDRLEAARRVEAGGHLMRQGFVLHKPILARRPDSPLVQPHGIKVPAFDASKLGRYQRVLVAESRWIVFGPLPYFFTAHLRKFSPPV